jgi:large conductance mechanosensitive channel
MMPPIAYWQQGTDFSKLGQTIGTITKVVEKDGVEMTVKEEVVVRYGALIQATVDFLIVAICLFIVIKLMNEARKRFDKQQIETPAEAPADVKLLTEIRDLLAAK